MYVYGTCLFLCRLYCSDCVGLWVCLLCSSVVKNSVLALEC